MPALTSDLLARLAEEPLEPNAVSALAQRLVADPAPEVLLDETLAVLSDSTVRVLSAALAEQLALEAAALDDRDASAVLHHAATLHALTSPHGPGQARCLSEAYTRYPSLETLEEIDGLLGDRTNDCQLAARAQLDGSTAGLEALKEIVARWVEASRFEHVIELLGATKEVHGEAHELLANLLVELNRTEASTAENSVEADSDLGSPESSGPTDSMAVESGVEGSEGTTEPPGQQEVFSFAEGADEEQDEEDASADAASLDSTHDQAMANRALMLERIAFRTLRADGDLKAARSALSGATDPPEDAIEALTTAAAQGDEDDWEAAAATLSRTIRTTEDHDVQYALMTELGRVYESNLNDPHRAERVYRRMRVIDPRSMHALGFYRDWEGLADDHPRAFALLALLHEALEGADLNDERVAIATDMAELAQGPLKSDEKAVDAWKRVLEDTPTHIRACRGLRTLFTKLERWPALADHLNAWCNALSDDELDQKVSLLFELIGVYQDPERLPVDAMVTETYQRIVAIAPNDVRALDQLASRYEDRERWEELVHVLSQKMDVTEDPAELVTLFGQVADLYLERIHSDRDAIPVLERILDVDPGSVDVIRLLRQIYERQHDSQHLYETFQRELEHLEGADRTDVLVELARLASTDLHLPEQAARWWGEVLEAEPGHREASRALGSLRVEQENWEEYVDLLKHRIDEAKTRKQRVEALLALGELTYTRLEDERRATEIFSEVCEISPFNHTARSFLQQIYVNRREWSQLEGLYAPRADWDGYLGLLRDTVRGTRDLGLVADIQVEMARVAAEHLDEPQQARHYLSQALEGSPQRVDVATLLLEQHLDRLTDDARLSAHEVIARHAEGALERENAWLEVASLRKSQDDAHGTFAALSEALVLGATRGTIVRLDDVMDAASAIHAWEDVKEKLDDALLRLPDTEAAEDGQIALNRALGHLHRARLSDLDGAISYFRVVLELIPGDEDALEALEAIHLSRNDLEALEEVLRARADHSQDPSVVRASLQELGKLYEEVLLDSARAASTYRDLLDLDPDDSEPMQDLERVLLVAGAHAQLAEALEDLIPRMGERDPRRGWVFRLATLYREELGETHAAVDHLRLLVEEEGLHRDGAVALLESMFEAGEATAPVAVLLANVYEERGDDERLATTLEACLETAATRDEKLAIADALLPLQEVKLDLPGQAFMTLGVRFQLDPDERDCWPKLLSLAEASGKQAELAELWRSALATDDAPGRPTSTEGVNHLRVMLARFVRLHFGEFEEPLALLEAVLRDAKSPAEHPEILEELEALHSDRHDPEALVRVLLAAGQAVLDADIRRQKVLDACTILRTELKRPAEALTHYQALYTEDPNHAAVAESIEETYAYLERWQELAEWLGRHAKTLTDPGHSADAHLRLVVLRHDRLDDREAAYEELRTLAEHEPTASRARGVLVEIARRTDTEEGQRNTLLDWVEAMARGDNDNWALAHVFEARTVGFTSGVDRAQYLFAGAQLLVPKVPLPKTFDDQRLGLKAFELAALALREQPDHDDALTWLNALVTSLDTWLAYVDACEDAATRADSDRASDLLQRCAQAAEAELEDIDRAIIDWRTVLTLAKDESAESAARALEELNRLFTIHDRRDDRIDLLTLRAERAEKLGVRLRLLRERAALLEEMERVDEAVAGLHEIITLSAGDANPDVAVERDEAMARLETLLTDQGRSEAVVDLLVESADRGVDTELAARWLLAAADIAETRLERPDDAAAIYERLLDLTPEETAAYEALDRIYSEAGSWDELALVLERRHGFQLASGELSEAVDTLFKLGQLARNRLGDEERAVAAYSECIGLEPTFQSAIEALQAASTRDQYGSTAREALGSAFRATEDWPALRTLLEERVVKGDQVPGDIDLHAELSLLCLDQMGDIEGAWGPALASFETADGDDTLVARRPLLTRTGLAVGARDELAQAILSGAQRMTSATGRGQMLADAGADLSEGGWSDAELESIWRATVDADPAQSDALMRLDGILRSTEERPAELAELLAVREAQSNDEDARDIRRERGLLLSKLPDRDAEALACLRTFQGDPQLDYLLGRLYEACAEWTALQGLLSDRLTRCDDSDAPTLKRQLALVLWQQLSDQSGAIALFDEVLQAIPGESDTIGHLETMWADGSERASLLPLLETHYRTHEDWTRLVSLYRTTVGDESQAAIHTECYEKIASIQLDHLSDPEAAYDTTKSLVRRAEDPFRRTDELEAVATAAGRWDDVAQFYEGLVIDGHGGLDFVVRLVDICKDRLEDSERAIRMLELAASRDPDDTTYDEPLSSLATAEGAWDTLLGHYKFVSANATEPPRIISARRLAADLLLTHFERPEEAARELEAAADLAPESTELANALADALRAAGERKGLIAHYQAWLARADEETQPEIRCRLAGIILTEVVDAGEGIRLLSQELAGLGREQALLQLTAFLRESTGTGEAWRRPIEVAASTYEEALGDDISEAQRAVAEAARLRVLPEGPEQHERRLKLAKLLESAGDPEASFALYAHALRDELDAPKLETALERLSDVREDWAPLAVLYAEVSEQLTSDEARARLFGKLAHLNRDRLEDTAQTAHWNERLLEARPGTLDALTWLAAHYAETQAFADEARVLEVWRSCEASMGYEDSLARRLAVVMMDGLEDSTGALRLFEELLPALAEEPEYSARLVQLYERSKRWNKLVSLCDLALAGKELTEAQALEWWLRKASVAETHLGDLDTAGLATREALELSPEDHKAWDQLARLERAREDWDALDGVLARHLELADGPDAWLPLHISRAELALYERNDPDEALSHIRHTDDLLTDTFPETLVTVLEGLSALDATRIDAAQRLEKPYRALERWEALFEVLKVRLEANGRDENIDLAMEMTTVAHENLRDPRLALRTALPSFRLSPANLALRSLVETLGEETAQWALIFEESEAAMEAIDETSQRADHARWLGDTMRTHDRPDSAVWAYEELLKTIPTDRGALEALETLHHDGGQPADLLAVLQRQLDTLKLSDRERSTVLMRMANVLETRMHDAVAARKTALAALDLDPDSRNALEVVARSAEAGEDWATLDDTLVRRLALASTPEDKIVLWLERADLARDRLSAPGDAVKYVLEADELDATAVGRADVVAALESLCRSADSQGPAAARLEGRLQASEDWNGVVDALHLQLEVCEDRAEGERLARRWAKICDDEMSEPSTALTGLLTGAGRFPECEALWHDAAKRAEELGSWRSLFDTGREALDSMVASRSKVLLGLWLADRHGEHGGDERGIRHALEHVLRAAPQHDRAFNALQQMHEATQNWAGLLDLLDLALAADDLPRDRRLSLLQRKQSIANEGQGNATALRDACGGILEIAPDDQEALRTLERLAREDDDWEALDLVLLRRMEIAGDNNAKLASGLQRAENALDRLKRPEAALTHSLAADTLAGPGPGHEGLIDLFESLLDYETTREAAAARLESRYRVRQDWARLFNVLALMRTALTSGEQVEALTVEMVRLACDELSDPSAGLRTLLVSFKAFPEQAGFRPLIAEVAEETGGWTEAFDAVESVLEREDDPAVIQTIALWLGQLYNDRVGYGHDAIHAFERVLAVDDVNIEAMDALETLYGETGAGDKLRELLHTRLNVAKDTERGDVLHRLAESTEQTEGPEASLTWWKELLWERPKHEAARQAVTRLLGVDATAEAAAGLLEPIFQREEDWTGLSQVLATRARLESDPSQSVALWMRLASLRETELRDAHGAFEAYASALEASPERRDVLRGLERMAESADLWDALASQLETLVQALDVEGRQTELLVRLGEIYEGRLSRPDRAVDSLRAALAIDPENRSVLKGLRRLYQSIGQAEPLLDITRQLALLARRPLEARELWTAVQTLCEQHSDYRGMLEATRKVLEITPSDEVASERLMDLLLELGEVEELANLLEQRARETTSPEKTANNLVRLATLRERYQDDPKGALAAYLEAWEQMPTHAGAFEAIRERYERDERWRDLLVVSRRRAEALAAPTEAASAWIAVAKLASERIHEPKEATRALEKALALDRRNQDVLRELGRLAESQDRMEDLAGYLTQLADVVEDPDERVTLRVRAATLYMDDLADGSRADALLESVLKHTPNHPGAIDALAQLRTTQGRYAEAAGLFERVMDSRQGSARMEGLCRLASLYDGYLGRTSDARGLLKEALELDEAADNGGQLATLLEQTEAWPELVALRERQYEHAAGSADQCDMALVLANLHLERLNDDDGFETWIEKAQGARRDNPKVVEALIAFYTSREQWDRVAPRLEWLVRYMEAKRLTEALPARAHQLASLMERLGQPHEALEYYKLSMQTDGTYLPNLVDYGAFLVRQSRWERALRVHQNLLIQSRKLSPEVQIQVLYHLALSCHELDQRDKAQQYLDRLLGQAPVHKGGLALKARISGTEP